MIGLIHQKKLYSFERDDRQRLLEAGVLLGWWTKHFFSSIKPPVEETKEWLREYHVRLNHGPLP